MWNPDPLRRSQEVGARKGNRYRGTSRGSNETGGLRGKKGRKGPVSAWAVWAGGSGTFLSRLDREVVAQWQDGRRLAPGREDGFHF